MCCCCCCFICGVCLHCVLIIIRSVYVCVCACVCAGELQKTFKSHEFAGIYDDDIKLHATLLNTKYRHVPCYCCYCCLFYRSCESAVRICASLLLTSFCLSNRKQEKPLGAAAAAAAVAGAPPEHKQQSQQQQQPQQQQQQQREERIPIDARAIFERFANADLGEGRVPLLQLCLLSNAAAEGSIPFEPTPEGFYRCIASIRYRDCYYYFCCWFGVLEMVVE